MAAANVGDTPQFTAAAFDAPNTEKSTSITWSSGDNSIATVDANRLVTAVAAGDVTIRATSAENVLGTARLHINAAVVTIASVTLAPSSASLITGATQQFTATVLGTDNQPYLNPGLTWSSSSPAATVDANGLVSAAAAGDATITATASNGVKGSANVHVDAPVVVNITGDVVISQIYGGGGNSSATYTNDYVELFNRGDQPQDITGWKIQYGSAGSSGFSGNIATLPGDVIAPGQHYLVQLTSGGAVGSALPTPDATGAINISASSGKVILYTPGTTPTGACPSDAGIIDHVAYGTSTNCESAWGNTGNLSNTSAAYRKNDGCVKGTDNSTDFQVLTPFARNSASPTKYCNGGPARAQSAATLVINELMGNPVNAESASWGQWFEVYNYGSQDIDLHGWKIVSSGTNQPDHTIASSVVVPAGGYAVIGRGDDINRNGGVTLAYNYFVGNATTIWLDNDDDYLMLVDNSDAKVDSVAWSSLPNGATKGLRDASLDNANVDGANWGYATLTFGAGDYGTPNLDNNPLSDTPPVISANHISFSGRTAADAPVPVGFEAQMFATEVTAALDTIRDGFTWEAMTPALATVDGDGVLHGLSAGTALFRVTAPDGTQRLNSVVIAVPVASTTAQYGNNTEFGDPVDLQSRDSYIIRRTQYTTSYNVSRGIPNWVAYDLNGTHIQVGADRCNCFTFDPELPASFPRYTTADYTGAGSYAGYGIDRGHMTRSMDRTTGTLDNATTFYFDNVVPQASDLNQGPWANEENYLGDLAQNSNKEVYIYVGPTGSKGTVKGEGKITIPEYTWKVALILPRGKGLGDVQSLSDVTVIATIMPNVSGIKNVDWTTYETSVDAVEALTGYDLLSALPDNIETALESQTHIPVAAIASASYSVDAHVQLTVDGSTSSDADAGQALTYQWSFGDGDTGTGVTSTHTYSRSGDFTLQLIVTDPLGIADTAQAVVHVADVTAAVITPTVTGTLGNNGWYTSDVQVSWNVSDPESDVASTTGCDITNIATDAASQIVACSAVNGFGLNSSQSVDIHRDASAPVVSFTGNTGTYTVADNIHILCSASDVGPSGVASTTCADLNVAAYTLALGMHTDSASATDNAGNVGRNSTSFTVTVSTSSLSALVNSFESNSGLQTSLVQKLAAAQAAQDRGDATAMAGQVSAFINQVEAQRGKTITSANADLLIALAQQL